MEASQGQCGLEPHRESQVLQKPVARLVPEEHRNLESVRAAVAGIFELRQQIFERNRGKPKLAAAEVKRWIEEGRR